eukprot:6492166-Amphidinium_carterae.5
MKERLVSRATRTSPLIEEWPYRLMIRVGMSMPAMVAQDPSSLPCWHQRDRSSLSGCQGCNGVRLHIVSPADMYPLSKRMAGHHELYRLRRLKMLVRVRISPCVFLVSERQMMSAASEEMAWIRLWSCSPVSVLTFQERIVGCGPSNTSAEVLISEGKSVLGSPSLKAAWRAKRSSSELCLIRNTASGRQWRNPDIRAASQLPDGEEIPGRSEMIML